MATYPLLGFSGCEFDPFGDHTEPPPGAVYEIAGIQTDPAGNSGITYPNQPFIPMLQRQANCSLTRFVLDQNYNVLAMDANYQDYLHDSLLPSTQGNQFKGGCSDTATGIGSQPGVFVPLANGAGAVATISSDGVDVKIVTSSGGIQSSTDYPTDAQPNATAGIALADFNGDGNLDMAVANVETGSSTTTGGVSILLGKGDGTFQNPANIALPFAPVGLTIDDLNGDGKMDLAVVGGIGENVSPLQVLLGKGDGTFGPPMGGPPSLAAALAGSSAECTDAVSADFNGDGKKDLALTCGQVLLGNGDGTFTLRASNIHTGFGVTAADFNGDGKIDLAVADPITNTVEAYLGKGDGTFSFAGAYASPYGIGAIRALDIDGDGNNDLFVGSAGHGVFGTGSINAMSEFESLLGTGNGNFVGVPAYLAQAPLASREPMYYGLGDLNGDGKPDLVYVDQNQNGPILQTLLGQGGTAFTTGPQTPLSAVPSTLSAVTVADFNGDGKLDVAIAGSQLQVAFGNGDGTFGTATAYTGFPTGISQMLAADFNGDGKPDIAYVGANPQSVDPNGNATGGVYILLNQGAQGAGTFGTPQLVGLSTLPNLVSLATGDLNGDGKSDLVVASGGVFNGATSAPGSIYTLIGQGNGMFGSPAAVSSTASWGPVAIADMNNDGKPDILAEGSGSSGTANLSIFPGNGDGAFGTPVVTPLADGGSDTIAVGDVNLDGNLDVVSGGCCGLAYTDVLYGNGNGTFVNTTSNQELLLGLSSHHLMLASLDGTKHLDIILVATDVNTLDASIEVIPNQIPGVASTSLTPTTTTLSASATTLPPGNAATFTAKVTETGGSGIPTGTVVFLDGATTIGTGTLDSTGTTTFSTSSLAAGAHSIIASYGGDAENAASLSSAVTITVNQLVATKTALSSSATSVPTGSSVTLSATVSGTGGTPTGTVTFSDGSTTLGTGTLNSSGTATYSTSTLAVGAHSITAAYGGDMTFAASTSSAVTITVTAPAPGFTLSLSPGTATVAQGSTATSTITVTPSGGFNNQISFACSGLPAYSTCSFSPATVTPGGSAAATTTMTVATNVTAASILKPNGGGETFLAWVLLGMSGLVRRRRRWNRLRWCSLLYVLLVAGVTTAMVACGGGGNSSSGGGTGTSTTTPAGTSTVTVTATAGSLSKTATFTFTVQ